MKKIILRADDLGYSEGVNYGIARTIRKGKVRTVGLIVNLEYSKQGYELIKDEDICLGLHVNISSGYPVNESEKLSSLVNENKEFKSSRIYNQSKYDFVVFSEVYEEVEAQYFRFKEITSREPDYIEGHAVFHETYFRAIETVAEKYHIPYIPVLTSPNETFLFCGTRLHFWMESMNPDYEPCRTLEKMCTVEREDCEVMVFHPGYIDDYLLSHSSLLLPRVKEVEFLTGRSFDEDICRYHVELVTYRELERGL